MGLKTGQYYSYVVYALDKDNNLVSETIRSFEIYDFKYPGQIERALKMRTTHKAKKSGQKLTYASICFIIFTSIQGCALSSETKLSPASHHIKCSGDTGAYPNSSIVSEWTAAHYFIYPIWFSRKNNDSEHLSLRITFKTKDHPHELNPKYIYVEDIKSKQQYPAQSIEIINQGKLQGFNHYVYKMNFSIKNHEINEFELNIEQDIFGCNIKPIHYHKNTNTEYKNRMPRTGK